MKNIGLFWVFCFCFISAIATADKKEIASPSKGGATELKRKADSMSIITNESEYAEIVNQRERDGKSISSSSIQLPKKSNFSSSSSSSHNGSVKALPN